MNESPIEMYETPIEVRPPKPEAYVDIELARLAAKRLSELLKEDQSPQVKHNLILLTQALKKNRKDKRDA